MNYRGLKALRAFAFGVVLSGLAVACQDGDFLPSGTAPEQAVQTGTSGDKAAEVTAQDVPFLNEQLEQLSRATARALSDPQIVKMIHAKALERFDKDTDVLWEHLDKDNAKFQGKAKGWSSLVLSKLEEKGKRSFASSQAMDIMLAKVERAMGGKLHLYWYQPEKWDGRTTPLVAYTPIDEKLGKRLSAPGFDADGRSYSIDEKLMNQRPVIVLTRNERTDARGEVKQKLQTASALSKPALKNGAATQSSYIRFRLHGILFNDHYEDIFSGDPEFQCQFKTTADANSFSDYPGFDLTGQIGRSGIGGWHGNGYWSGNLERSFWWDQQQHKTLYVKWYEYDPPPFWGGGDLTLELSGDFKIGDIGTLKPSVKFQVKLPTTTTTELQGWSIHYDHPASPAGTTRRTYYTGSPNVEFGFDPY